MYDNKEMKHLKRWRLHVMIFLSLKKRFSHYCNIEDILVIMKMLMNYKGSSFCCVCLCYHPVGYKHLTSEWQSSS